jgi:ribosomal protein S18 acetylase RimI-like enzyme
VIGDLLEYLIEQDEIEANIEVVGMRRKDIRRIFALDRKIFGQSSPLSKKEYRSVLRDPTTTAYYVTSEYKDIGYGISTVLDSGVGWIFAMGFIEEYTSRKLGTKLFTVLENDLIKRGLEVIRVDTHTTNVAMKNLLQKFGYTPIEIISDFYPDGDAVIYIKYISDD